MHIVWCYIDQIYTIIITIFKKMFNEQFEEPIFITGIEIVDKMLTKSSK